jgi:hypothetical protein
VESVFQVIPFGEREMNNFFEYPEGVNYELFKVLLKHRRFVYGCPAPEELNENRGWHFKFDATVICHRIYEIEAQKSVREDYDRRIIRVPCLSAKKQHEVWLFTPGVSGIFFFCGGKYKSCEYYRKKIDEYLNDVFCRIPGVTPDGNDLLVNGGKAAGMETLYSAAPGTLQFTAGLTYDAGAVKKYASAFDYSKKKYKTLAGFKETGISEADFDGEIRNFYEAVKCL